MSSIVCGYQQEIDSCTAYLGLDGGTWRVHLSTTSTAPTRASVPGDFADPTYTGYATQPTGGWGGAVIDGLGNATAPGLASLTFTPLSMLALPQTVYSWWVEDVLGNFQFGALLPAPFTFVDLTSTLTLIPSFSSGQLA